ncbi:tetracycline efflux (otrb) [Fusarium sp. NRRL 52700]|nr:tetracycline efflux (otrb) [Fusarium sp. NRRL 52700]
MVLTKDEKALHDQVNLLPRPQLVTALATLSAALLLVIIDQNGISVIIPTIAKDLDAGATISWAGTSSLIANTCFQMLYGRLSDVFGRKVIFVSAALLLCVADLLCSLSQNAIMFYVSRAIAGIGGGGVQNLVNIIISDIVTLEQRGKIQGVVGGTVGLGNVIGPFIAAGIMQKSSWRAFFWLLTPLSFITAVLSYLYLPSKPPTIGFWEGISKIDWVGSLVSGAGIVLLLIPISGGGSYFSWDSPLSISFLAVGGALFIAFIGWEWKMAKLPMMPGKRNYTKLALKMNTADHSNLVDIYKNSSLAIMLAQNCFLGAVYQSYLYYVPLYLQNPHQYSAMKSAAVYTPLVAAQMIASIGSGQYISRRLRYGEVIIFGFAIWTLGAGLALLFTRHSSPAVIAVILAIVGTGVGCIFQPTLIALQAHSPKSRRAVIISNRNFYRCIGGACGLAVSAAVLQAQLRATLPIEYKSLASSTYVLPESMRQVPAVLDAYMSASHSVFILQVPLIGLCLLGTAFIRDRGLDPVKDTETFNLVTPGDWVDFFRFSGIAFDGLVLPEQSGRDEEKLMATMLAAKDKFDVHYAHDFNPLSSATGLKRRINWLSLCRHTFSGQAQDRDGWPAASCLVPSFSRSSAYERSIFKSFAKFATVDHCLFVIEGKLKVEIEGSSGENVLHDGEAVVISTDRGFKLDFASPFDKFFSVANGRGIEILIQDTGKPFEGFVLPDRAEKLEKVDSAKLARVAKEIGATIE